MHGAKKDRDVAEMWHYSHMPIYATSPGGRLDQLPDLLKSILIISHMGHSSSSLPLLPRILRLYFLTLTPSSLPTSPSFTHPPLSPPPTHCRFIVCLPATSKSLFAVFYISLQPPRAMEVQLYLYDLSRGLARSMSASLLGHQLDAIYHTSIVLQGVEYVGLAPCLKAT